MPFTDFSISTGPSSQLHTRKTTMTKAFQVSEVSQNGISSLDYATSLAITRPDSKRQSQSSYGKGTDPETLTDTSDLRFETLDGIPPGPQSHTHEDFRPLSCSSHEICEKHLPQLFFRKRRFQHDEAPSLGPQASTYRLAAFEVDFWVNFIVESERKQYLSDYEGSLLEGKPDEYYLQLATDTRYYCFKIVDKRSSIITSLITRAIGDVQEDKRQLPVCIVEANQRVDKETKKWVIRRDLIKLYWEPKGSGPHGYWHLADTLP
jgi:hypothetical protein